MIYGKTYSAFVLKRLADDFLSFKQVLYYNPNSTTPDLVKQLYPMLGWDYAIAITSGQLSAAVPGYAGGGIAALEAAMLNKTYLNGTVGPGLGESTAAYLTAYVITDLLYNTHTNQYVPVTANQIWGPTPGGLWSNFPANGLQAATLPATFGPQFGNGLIGYEMVNWGSGANPPPGPGGAPFTNHSPANWNGLNVSPYGTGDPQLAVIYFNSIVYIFTPSDDGIQAPQNQFQVYPLGCWSPCGNLLYRKVIS